MWPPATDGIPSETNAPESGCGCFRRRGTPSRLAKGCGCPGVALEKAAGVNPAAFICGLSENQNCAMTSPNMYRPSES
jgi:hypothetical protein